MGIERFEEIKAWQLGRQLTRLIYSYAKAGEFQGDWGLRDQITRAAGSIMNNIAEGYDSGTNKEFLRFLGYAKRSCTEVQSQLYIAHDQQYITTREFRTAYSLAAEARAATQGFISYLQRCHRQSTLR